MRLTAAIAGLLLLASSAAALDVPVVLTETAGVARSAEPASVGVPLPRGLLADTAKLCVVDPRGAKVPAQFEALMHWFPTDKFPDKAKTIRWVLVDFQADVPANGKAVYRLTDGGPGPAHPDAVQVATRGDVVSIRTGPLAFSVSGNAFRLFEEASLNGKAVIEASSRDGVAVEGMDGKRYTSTKDLVEPPAPGEIPYRGEDAYLKQYTHNPPGKLRAFVEKAGPLRSVVTVEGLVRALGKSEDGYEFVLYNAAGDKVGPIKLPCKDEGLGFRVRIHAYAGKPFVRVFFTQINPRGVSHTATDQERYRSAAYIADACLRPGEFLVEALELSTTLKLTGPARYRFGGARVHAGPLPADGRLALYQDSSAGWIWQTGTDRIYDPVLKKNMEQLGRKTGGVEPPYHEYSDIHYKILTGQDGGTFMGYRLLDAAGKAVASGNRAAGWADVTDGQVGLTAAVRWFWQMVPKSIELDGAGRVTVGLLPRQWGRGHFLDGKTRRTHELLYRFHAEERPAETESAVRAFNAPLVPYCDFDWYLDSGACNLFARPDEKNWLTYEAQISTAVRVGVNPKANVAFDSSFAIEREKDDAFGWQHFGDTSKRGFRGHSQFQEFDSSRCLMMHYWRTGDPAYWREAEVLARFLADIPCFGGGYGHQHPESSHNWIQGLIDYWCTSGDLQARDAIDAMKGFYVNCQNEAAQNWHYNGRNAAYALNGLRQFYELTGDPAWAKAANTCIRSVKQRTRPVSGFYGGNPADFMQHVLCHALGRHAMLTDDEDAVDLLLGLAGYFKPFSGQGGGGDTADCYALATMLTGDPTYLKAAVANNKDSQCADASGPHYRTGTASSKTWSGGIGGYYQVFFYATRHWKPTDTTPPDPVTDLAAAPGEKPGTVTLTWTNTGDDGAKGRAARVQVKFASGEIVELVPWGRDKMDAVVEPQWKDKVNYWYADNATGEPAPAAPGQKQSFTVTGLPSGKTLHFAVKLHDEAGNRGGLSNCVKATVP